MRASFGCAVVSIGLCACTSGGQPGGNVVPHDSGTNDARAAMDAAVCRRPFHGGCLEVVVGTAYAPSEMAVDDTHLYFSFGTGGSVFRADRSTHAVESLGTAPRLVAALIVDADNVYYSTGSTSGQSDASVGRIDLVTHAVTELVTGLSSNGHLAVDGGYLYFTQFAAELARVAIAGGPKEHLSNATWPGWIGADGGQMYWIERVWNGTTSTWSGVLSHATPDFSFAENLETANVTAPGAMTSTHVYWYDHFGGGIYRTPRVKGTTESLGAVAPDNVTRSYDMGVSATYVYFITSQHTVARVPIGGGVVEDVLANSFILDLAVASDGAYVSLPNEGAVFVPDLL